MPDGRVYELADRFKRDLLARDARAQRVVIDAYGNAYERIQREARRFIELLEREALSEGVSVAEVARLNPSWPFMAERLDRFSDQVARALADVVDGVASELPAAQREAVEMALEHAERLTLEGALARLDPALATDARVGLRAAWDRLNTDALEYLVGTLADGTPVASVLHNASIQGAAALRDALLGEFVLGHGPRQAAARVRAMIGGDLVHALKITRTEFIRAYRLANRDAFRANRTVVGGWLWHASLDGRSCLGCVAKHGSFHESDEVLSDHVQGRCAMLPQTPPWSVLARDLEASGALDSEAAARLSHVPDNFPDVRTGASWLADQSLETQIKLMGRTRTAVYRDGIPLNDLVVETVDPTWGRSVRPKPLRDLFDGDGSRLAVYRERGFGLERAAAGVVPVSARLSNIVGDDGFRAVVTDTLAIIDRVHSDGFLPQIPVRAQPGADFYGAYHHLKGGRAVSILVNTDPTENPFPHLSLVHETGHLIDHYGIGSGGRRFASEIRDTALDDWWTRVQSSRAVRDLTRILEDHVDLQGVPLSLDEVTLARYLLRPKELFARSYAQWVVSKSGDHVLAAELATVLQTHGRMRVQWEADDFEATVDALDALFKNKGWL